MLPSVNEKFERESNLMPQLLNLYLSESAFLVGFTEPNKQHPKVKSVFKSRDHVSNSYTIKKFTTLLGVKGVLSCCLKQLCSNLNLILDLFHMGFGETLVFVYKEV